MEPVSVASVASVVSSVLLVLPGPIVDVGEPSSVVTVEIVPGNEVGPPTELPSPVLVPVLSLSAASNAAVSWPYAGTAHPVARRSDTEAARREAWGIGWTSSRYGVI